MVAGGLLLALLLLAGEHNQHQRRGAHDGVAVVDRAPHFGAARATAPPESEGGAYAKTRPCKSFAGAFFCGMEWDEWVLVDALVDSDRTVLEFGARFGTTSCALARATRNSGGVVSVEPDSTVHASLLANRDANNCSFHVVKGSVGSVPIALSPRHNHYATQTVSPAEQAELVASAGRHPPRRVAMGAVPSISYREIEAELGLSFDTLLIDCEGCIGNVLSGDNMRLLAQVRLVIIEEDVPHETDYAAWHALLRERGFRRTWRIRDTFNLNAAWSQNVTHSAWERGEPLGKESCPQYSQRKGYSRRQLQCLHP